MTARDRLMLVGLAALALLVGGWLLVVSPEKQRASKIAAEVAAARQKLAATEAQAAEATKARARYASAYSSMVDLGQAVPATQETPALIYALDAATHVRHVVFSSITTSASGSGSSGPAPAAAASAPSGAQAGAAGAASAAFKQQPFTFVFDGSFEDLYKLFAQLESFTKETSSGTLQVNGRLLTIDSVQLAPGAGSSSGAGAAAASSNKNELTGTVTATAYVLPPGQTPLAGASPTAPAGATPAAAGGGSTPTTTAVVKGAP